MLELRNIVKDYVSDNNVTHALKGVSVTFRKNEFVSILGPSGCGKTTLLNIIGGLDRYTSGDLLILGTSTKEYKDRDWDTYRNHSIGFVFQTYNLISHQNILKNVELALTISGVSKEERRERAYQALKVVGLEGMEKKKPNQLSGGQCQRVAIARALINNPEILLADEPTGALDSETSVQIMDLLKEVASDRLVIMVTHNPDLANKYSTRIINMKDGLLTHDSNPYDGKDIKKAVKTEKLPENPANSEEISEVSKGKKKKTSMSLLTSIGLSTSNLISKMKRTVLVVIAGSIGIIGVSTVLAASRGVKDYIKDLQNDMLSSYPITVAEEAVDYSALIAGLNSQQTREKPQFDPKDPKVGVDSMISYLMDTYKDLTNVKTNTIDEKLVSFIKNMPKDQLGSMTFNYGIDPTNNVFGKFKGVEGEQDKYYSFNGLTQRYIAELKTVEDFGEYATFVDLFTSFMNELPEENDYITDQYELVAGDPYNPKENELVLVVDQETTLTDVLLAQMGVFEHDDFLNVAICAIEEQKVKQTKEYEKMSKEQKEAAIAKVRADYPYTRAFTFEQLMNRDFYYFPQDTIYHENSHVADDKITISLNFIILDGSTFKRFVSLSFQSLLGYNILYGNTIYEDGGDYKTETVACLNSRQLVGFKVNTKEDLYGDWFAFSPNDLAGIDMENFNFDTIKSLIKFKFNVEEGNVDHIGFASTFSGTYEDVDEANWEQVHEAVAGYSYEAIAKDEWIADPTQNEVKGMKMRISSILRLKDSKSFGSLSRGLYYSKQFADKFRNDSKDAIVTTALKEHMSKDATRTSVFKKAYVTFPYFDHTNLVVRDDGYASTLNTDLGSSFSDLFSSFTGSDVQEKNGAHLRSLCGYKAIVKYDNNGDFDGVEFKELPKQINIYPKSFDGKDEITKYLDVWNSDEVLTIDGVQYTKAMRDDLTYSDTISLIAAVIDTFIDAITIALIVFTSLSLVVSCFMIAVITYISVVERIKEIGVIRSLGGRKRDVAGLFVTETFMTGLFSGVFGIAITYILQIIVNIILKANFGLAIIKLTVPTALLMIGVSVVLSVLSGLLPSQSAAHKDPVVALRSNE